MIDIVETEPGVYSVLLDGASFEARVEGGAIRIGWDVFRHEVEDPRRWKRSSSQVTAGGHASLMASMPGKVVRVLVSVGDEVEAGQAVIVVEAMKMQNELKAPHAGRVLSVAVKENDSVNAGAVLATIGATSDATTERTQQ